MTNGEIEPIEDLNPITEIRKKTDTALVIERTPRDPVTLTTTHVIEDLREEIEKLQAVVDIWQARITPLQNLVNEYEGMV